MAAGGHQGQLAHDQLTSGKVLPDVVSHLPQEVLNIVVFYRNVEVENGVHMRVAATQIRPHVEIRGKGFGGADDKWTLLMVDPDAPSPDSPSARCFLHWVVVDIPGSTAPNQEIWETGKELIPYMGPAPPSGTHRYVFMAFKQEGHTVHIGDLERPHLSVNSFMKQHGLGEAEGALYFCAKHDDDLEYGSRQA